jgi:hypothetical protein
MRFEVVCRAFGIPARACGPRQFLVHLAVNQTLDDKAVVRKAIAVFREVQGRALTAEESRAVIAEAIKKWKSLQQQ